MLRKIIGVVVGLLAAMLLIAVVESINTKIFPLPKDVDIANPRDMEKYITTLPNTAFILVLIGWAIGSFVCGLLIRMISKSADKVPAYIAGLLLMTAGIVTMFQYPHPWWFIGIGLLIFIPLTLYGHNFLRRD